MIHYAQDGVRRLSFGTRDNTQIRRAVPYVLWYTARFIAVFVLGLQQSIA